MSSNNILSTNPILSSPFYQDDANALPNGALVEKGQLYMMDDAGGVVFQVFAPPENQIDGSLDFEGNVATIHSDNTGLQAISYKATSAGSDHPVSLGDSIIISNLIESGRDPILLNSENKLKVTTSTNDFYVYNVHDRNGQLAMIHESPAQSVGSTTDVEVQGLLYIQVIDSNTDDTVYIGFVVTPIQLSIWDPNGEFRP